MITSYHGSIIHEGRQSVLTKDYTLLSHILYSSSSHPSSSCHPIVSQSTTINNRHSLCSVHTTAVVPHTAYKRYRQHSFE